MYHILDPRFTGVLVDITHNTVIQNGDIDPGLDVLTIHQESSEIPSIHSSIVCADSGIVSSLSDVTLPIYGIGSDVTPVKCHTYLVLKDADDTLTKQLSGSSDPENIYEYEAEDIPVYDFILDEGHTSVHDECGAFQIGQDIIKTSTAKSSMPDIVQTSACMPLAKDQSQNSGTDSIVQNS